MDDDARHIKALLTDDVNHNAIVRKRRKPVVKLKDEAVVLSEIEQALERLDGGSFGYCIECGKPLDILRLAHDPTISCCVGCKDKARNAK
ncbi:MAG: hypothetical protein AAF950_15290 [Pseudomonadota bacterium]